MPFQAEVSPLAESGRCCKKMNTGIVKICYGLFLVSYSYSLTTTTNNLLFTVPEQTLKTAQGAVNKRFTFDLLFPWTIEEVTALFDSITVIVNSWKNLGFFSDESIKSELSTQLDNGIGIFAKVKKYFEYFLNLLGKKDPITKKSSCKYELEFLNKGFFTNTSIFLTNMWAKIVSSWTPDDLRKDTGKYSLILDVIQLFNYIADVWFSETYKAVNIWDSLDEGIFPEQLKGTVDIIPCLEGANIEDMQVIECENGLRELYCNIDARYPQVITPYTFTKNLNYDGVELALLPGQYLATNEEGFLKVLNCSKVDEQLGIESVIPICYENNNYEKCRLGLEGNNVEAVLENCDFNYKTPEIAIRLEDNGILVQGQELKINIGGSEVLTTLPALIYSNQQVIISDKTREIKFPAVFTFAEELVITTKLITSQIKIMKEKAYWKKLRDFFSLQDYILIGISGISIVLIFVVCFVQICCCDMKMSKMNRKIKRMKTEKQNNYKENKHLLKKVHKQKSKNSPFL